MPNAKFQIYDGNSFVDTPSEVMYQSLNYIDTFHHPQKLSVTIINSSKGGELNALEDDFSRYQRIRIIEGNSEKILFQGKIDKVVPKFDEKSGQTLVIEASDNLMELMKNTVNSDASYPEAPIDEDTDLTKPNVPRVDVIRHLINGPNESKDSLLYADHKPFQRHSQEGNINTTISEGFPSISTNVDGNHISYQLEGSKKNVLRVIEEISLKEFDPDIPTEGFGYDYYLDNEDEVPKFQYFKRGSNPSESSRLNLSFRGLLNHNTKNIRPNYSFPKASDEIITKVRIEYNKFVPDTNEDGSLNFDEGVLEPQTRYVILVYVDGSDTPIRPTGEVFLKDGTLRVAQKITWGSDNGEANVIRVTEQNIDGNNVISLLLADTPEGGLEKINLSYFWYFSQSKLINCTRDYR